MIKYGASLEELKKVQNDSKSSRDDLRRALIVALAQLERAEGRNELANPILGVIEKMIYDQVAGMGCKCTNP